MNVSTIIVNSQQLANYLNYIHTDFSFSQLSGVGYAVKYAIVIY